MNGSVDYFVYFKDKKPDCIYAYYHKPEEGVKPYGVIYGYWLNESKEFHENRIKKHMLMDYEHFKTHILPKDQENLKTYSDLNHFFLELI